MSFFRHGLLLTSGVLLLLAVFCSFPTTADAKVINADADASYLTKLVAGVSQGLTFTLEYLVGESVSTREPTRVSLALVGLGRTGSSSLVAALRSIGMHPVHDDETEFVGDIFAGMMDGSMPFDEVHAELGRRGFDAPMISTKDYVRYVATQPDVKVLLAVRDPKKWARSWLKITPLAKFSHIAPFCWFPVIRDMRAYADYFFFELPTQGHPELYEDLPTLEAGFEAYVQFVKDTVPADRLLLHDVRDGWEPLCEFLGIDVPDEPFPHINDGDTVSVIVTTMLVISWIWPLFVVAPFALVYCCCCRRRCRRGEKGKVA